MDRYRVDFKPIPWESPLAGVKFKPHIQGTKRLRLVEYTKEFVEPDWCTKGHIGYVLEGQLEIDFNGQVIGFGPGDGIFIPPGEEHKHKARIFTDIVKVFLVEEV